MKNKEIEQFLRESNAIEGVYDLVSFEQARIAWEYLSGQKEMTSGVVLKAHKILMLYSNLQPNEKGYFRRVGVSVGGRLGMDWSKIPEAMGNWCANTMKSRWSAKKLHVAFEKIHPFVDGNGRVGRILMNWTRLRKKQPILIIKESEKKDYYEWFI